MGIIFSGGGVGGAVGLGISLGDGLMHVLTAADFSSQYMPLLNSYLIDKVGIGWTLRIIAISTGLVAVSRRSGMFLHQLSSQFPPLINSEQGLVVPFIRPRLPITRPISISTSTTNTSSIPLWKTFATAGFWGCFLSTLLQGFGYLLVSDTRMGKW
jgi:hypothetical protein